MLLFWCIEISNVPSLFSDAWWKILIVRKVKLRTHSKWTVFFVSLLQARKIIRKQISYTIKLFLVSHHPQSRRSFVVYIMREGNQKIPKWGFFLYHFWTRGAIFVPLNSPSPSLSVRGNLCLSALHYYYTLFKCENLSLFFVFHLSVSLVADFLCLFSSFDIPFPRPSVSVFLYISRNAFVIK